MNIPCINSYTNKYNSQGPKLTYCDRVIEEEKRLRVIDIHSNFYLLIGTPVCYKCWSEYQIRRIS